MGKENNYKQAADELRERLGQDSPLAALIEKGPDEMERVAKALTARIPVQRNTIDERVVMEFSRLIKMTAQEKRDDLEMVRPFHIYNVLYSEVMEEVKNKSSAGLDYYQSMVIQLPTRFYFNE